ncbi:MAG: LamG domain-containing protein, partial [Actinomycetia bacterium]|nr:LamG domain-containing protein [Actinomycetes bacterium]
MVGAHGGGGSWNLAGEIYVAEVYDDDGIVERIAAADATVGASTFVSSISAATVTIAGTAALDSDPPEVNYGTGDTLAVTGGTGHSLADGPRPGQQATLFAGGVSGVGEDTMDIDNPGHTGGFTLAFSSSMALAGTGTGTRYYASYTAGGSGWSLFTYQNGNVYFKTVDGGGSYNHIWTAALALDGTWEHVALVYDGATTASLYVDGVLVSAKTVTAPVDNAGTVDLSIGKAWVSGGGSRVMDMTIAEYLFTSTELTAAQIGELAATALSRGHWLSVADLDWPNSFNVSARVQVDEWPNQP